MYRPHNRMNNVRCCLEHADTVFFYFFFGESEKKYYFCGQNINT